MITDLGIISDKEVFGVERPPLIDPKVSNKVRLVLIDQSGKVAFLKWQKPSEWQFLIGGRMEVGENPNQTAVREAKEETGLEISAEDFELIAKYTEVRNPSEIFDPNTDQTAKPIVINSTVFYASVESKNAGETNYDEGEKKSGAKTIWKDLSDAIEIFSNPNPEVYASHFVAKIEADILKLIRDITKKI